MIQANISAEEVVSAMLDDAEFALEMWKEIAEKLYMGMLLDDYMNLVQTGFVANEKDAFIGLIDLTNTYVEMDLKNQARQRTTRQPDAGLGPPHIRKARSASSLYLIKHGE